MKKYYIATIFFLSLLNNVLGQTYPISNIDLGVVNEDRRGYYKSNMCESTQFEIIFDINLYYTVTFTLGMEQGHIEFEILSFENTDINKQYSPFKEAHHDGDSHIFEYKLSPGRYKVIVLGVGNSNCSNKLFFSCDAKIDMEKREIQFGDLTDKKFAFSSIDMLDKDTRFEIFFEINLYSSVTFRHGLDNGSVSFALVGLENIDTKEKYFPNHRDDQIDYYDYGYKLNAGRYKVIVLAIVEFDYYHEIYYQCSVEPEIIEKEVQFGNLTQKKYDSYSPVIVQNTLFKFTFNITLPASVSFLRGFDSGQIDFEMPDLENKDTKEKKIPYNVINQIKQSTYEYNLSAGSYTITVFAKTLDVHNEAVFRCFIRDETSTPVDSTVNYIISRTYTNEIGAAFIDQIQYFDGLGRPEQTIQKGITVSGKDLVFLQEYDAFGRESSTWLPAAIHENNGAYVTPATVKTHAVTTNGNDSKPYSYPVYEASPLSRVQKQFGPGVDWQENIKAVSTEYKTNVVDDAVLNCKLYMAGGAPQSPVLYHSGNYATGELYVTGVRDEENNTSYEFKDKLGKVVLTRQMIGNISHDTYYVYNDYGHLCFVLPPSIQEEGISPVKLNELAYRYKYDNRNRCISNKLPGCEWIHYVYDKADRQIFSQDGIQRTKGQWSFSIPDNLGRIVLTGTCISANSTAISIGRFDNSIIKAELFTTTGTYKGYNVKLNSGDLTLDNAVVLSVNYYDGYDFLGTNDIPNNDATQFKPEAGYGLQLTSSKSLLTGTVTAKMNADGSTPTYLYSVMYYDNLGRLIQTKSNNQLEEGTEEEHIAYTFTGKIKNRKRVHSAMGKATHAEVYSYSYDHAERLLSVSHQLNEGNALTLAQYTYDEVGRIKTKTLASETSNYSYNVRSWLTQIAGSKFNQTLVYNQSINGITPTKALYNGNISAMKWKAGNETTERGYKFTYDNLSRLTDANYGEGASIASNLNRFNEKLSYDKMGNIMTLQRGGKITSSTYNLIDNLTYTYTGNQITKVTDAVTTPITNENTLHFVDGANVDNEYAYDVNGNLIKDLNKNITSITYNYLNLPNIITFADGNTITYDYDANGNKLSVAYKIGGNIAKTEYVGNKVYKNGTLSMILTEEGYITMTGTIPTYHYFLKDHQGNNRVVINQSGTVEQVNHYYPFGGLFGEGMQDSNQPYKYNGKEFDNLLGLNMYDFHWRQYMADIGRTTTMDPHAENYYSQSPYSMFANNPVLNIDPDGRDWYRHDEDESVMWSRGSDAVDGYTNIGTHYTLNLENGISLTYNQNTPETMVETVLNAEDWSSQILGPEVGDCFTHSGIMVASSGAESHNTPNQNIIEIDNGIEYLDQQIDQLRSARVHVDRINDAGEGSGRGRHWVAISSRTTDLQSGKTTSFGFFEPGTRHFTLGTSSDNRLNVSQGGLTGPTTYSDKFTYNVTSIRRNK